MIYLYGCSDQSSSTGYGKVETGIFGTLSKYDDVLGHFNCHNHLYQALQNKINDDDLHLVLGSPVILNINENEARKPWIYTMCESNKVNEVWAKFINQSYERVLVPTRGLKNSFMHGGINVPIHIVGFGMDEYPYIKKDPDPEIFTWLTYSYGGMRKGAEKAMFAFDRLFKGNENHRLIVHVSNHDSFWLKNIDHPQIEIVRKVFTKQEQRDFYAQANVFLFPSRAEGIGLPPRETTLSGIPTIATRWLGMDDVDEWGWGLDYVLEKSADIELHGELPPHWVANATKNCLWAEVNDDDLDKKMLLLSDPSYYEEAIRLNQDQHIPYLEQFTWETTAKNIIELRGSVYV